MENARQLCTVRKITRIGQGEFARLLTSLSGLPISRVWRGYGDAIFLELGKLHPDKNSRGIDSPKGDFSLMIEWGWRFEKARSIWFGSSRDLKMIDARLPKLVGCNVNSAWLEGRLPELRLTLSGGLWFGSFSFEEGRQDWTIFDRSQCYYAKGQSFFKET
jgi:hypothetical protein